MTEPLALAIDQGTHASRAILVDTNGVIRFSAFTDIGLSRKGKLRVEQDPEEILDSVHSTIKSALTKASALGDVVCAGLAVQRSSIVAWDRRSGRSITPVISWQDRRALQWLQRFSDQADTVKELTGLPFSPHYGAGKLRWLLAHHPEVKKAYGGGYLAWGPLAAFLLYNLLKTSPYVVDHANAQRTQLWNLYSRSWDPQLLDRFQIPQGSLPESFPTCHNYGHLVIADIPVTAVTGDQTAAFFSLGKPSAGTATINIGTGAFILAPTGSKPIRHPKLLSGLLNSTKGRALYAMEGTVNGAGAAFSWAGKTWQIPDLVLRMKEFFNHSENPPTFINTVGGLGSPWWEPDISPRFVGEGNLLERAVAVAESILFLIQANLDTFGSTAISTNRLQVTGGLSHMDEMCQRMADLSGMKLYRPSDTEATARGIAWLAFKRPRRWPKPGKGRIFEPRKNTLLRARYKRFHQIMEEDIVLKGRAN